MLKSSVSTIAMLMASQGAWAQQAPDAGRQLQQIPQAPAQPRAAPEIRIERGQATSDAAVQGIKVRVDALRVTGQTLFSESQLIAVTGFRPSAELSLSDLRAIAAKITAFYNSRGYVLAQAYLPAQDIKDGLVTIAVIEGRYGKIDLRNRSNLSDGVARDTLGGLAGGDLVETAPLERRLLLLSDIPGVVVRSTLAPGAAVGTSDLIVDVAPGRRVTGSVEADNAGNRYTGAYRLGGTVNFNNPTGHGDVLSLRVLASTSNLIYGRASYQTLVGVSTLGVAYAHIDYELGREFKSLDAEGTADVFTLYGSHPLIRSRDTNLYALADAEAKIFRDKVGVATSVADKKAQVLSGGLSGDHHDDFGGGGWSNFTVRGSFGHLDIQSVDERATDRVTARRDGTYGKLELSAARLQTLTGPLSLYAAVSGQIASKNLDSSEQMSLGGAYGVRAYPEGEAYGDEGYLATVEARLLLPKFSKTLPGRVQLFGFVDAGAVTIAKNPWFVGSNSARRSAFGAGVSWAGDNDFIVRGTYARKLGDADATSAPDRSGRAWFQIVKLF